MFSAAKPSSSDRVSEPNSCDTQTEEIPNDTSAMPSLPTSAEAQPQRPTRLEPIPASSSSEIGSHIANVSFDRPYLSGSYCKISCWRSSEIRNSMQIWNLVLALQELNFVLVKSGYIEFSSWREKITVRPTENKEHSSLMLLKNFQVFYSEVACTSSIGSYCFLSFYVTKHPKSGATRLLPLSS